MISKFSKIKKANFIEETFEQFAERNGIETEMLIPSNYSPYFSDVTDIAEAYFNLIPKTYKKQFPPKKESRALFQDYLDAKKGNKEFQKIIIENFEKLFAQINAAVEKDRQDWNNIPTLPGLSNKGRKPGSKNKEKVIPVEESIPLEKIETLTQNLSGASHKDIREILDSIFPVTDEDIEAYQDMQELTPEKTIDVLLAVMYEADIEVAAKEGDTDLVKYLLTETEKDRILGQNDLAALEKKSETIHEPKPFGAEPDEDVDAAIFEKMKI